MLKNKLILNFKETKRGEGESTSNRGAPKSGWIPQALSPLFWTPLILPLGSWALVPDSQILISRLRLFCPLWVTAASNPSTFSTIEHRTHIVTISGSSSRAYLPKPSSVHGPEPQIRKGMNGPYVSLQLIGLGQELGTVEWGSGWASVEQWWWASSS